MTKYAPLTVAQVVSHVRSAPDEDTKLRWCLQFLDDFSAAENEVRATLVADDPGYCGDRRWDAYVAALTEHLVASYDLAAPSWLFRAGRFLERWWFPVDLPQRPRHGARPEPCIVPAARHLHHRLERRGLTGEVLTSKVRQ